MKKQLSTEEQNKLFEILKNRFKNNMHRHKDLTWLPIQEKLEQQPTKILSLYYLEETSGEPDVVDYVKESNEYLFVDCTKESPKERRSLCYDKEALASRKKFKPKDTVIDVVKKMEIELLDENQYKHLQQIETIDTKTSSWLLTPKEIRKLGGAIFGDFRFGRVFIYHNGAESYYASRGFRAALRV